MSTVTETEREFTIVRRLEAPREVVFQAWTDPDHLHWFANPGHPPHHPTTVDLRVGGSGGCTWSSTRPRRTRPAASTGR